MRMHPLSKQSVHHKGIDIPAKMGTPVLSTGNGIVKEAGYDEKSGNFVTIRHNDLYETKYLHLLEFLVSPKDYVEKGQMIGKVGNSGLSMMPHLHYEILKNEIPVNPKIYINNP